MSNRTSARAMFAVGDTVVFARRHKDHKAGSSLVVGMSGEVTRVIPAAELHDAHGEACRIVVEFSTVFAGRFTETLWASEARFIGR